MFPISMIAYAAEILNLKSDNIKDLNKNVIRLFEKIIIKNNKSPTGFISGESDFKF